MDNSWVKISSKIVEDPIFENPNLLRFWIWCLSNAAAKQTQRQIGLTRLIIFPGQFITGRKTIAEALNISESTAYKYLKYFEKLGLIKVESTNKYSLITVINWDKYIGASGCEE